MAAIQAVAETLALGSSLLCTEPVALDMCLTSLGLRFLVCTRGLMSLPSHSTAWRVPQGPPCCWECWAVWALTDSTPGLLETTVQKVARVKAPNKSLPSAVYCIEDKMSARGAAPPGSPVPAVLRPRASPTGPSTMGTAGGRSTAASPRTSRRRMAINPM